MTTGEIIDLYITTIKAKLPGIEPREGYTSLSHVLWMLYQMKEMLPKEDVLTGTETGYFERREKFNQWLGFVQGVLWWATAVFSVEDFHNHTRNMTYE